MSPIVKWWPRPADYFSVWQAMYDFTKARTSETNDQIWLCEHAPVYTLGQAGRLEHVLQPNLIPLIKTDRGGQVTYHGLGQILAYVLCDLRRAKLFVKEYVNLLEEAIIQTLADLGLPGAIRQAGAPGVYIAASNGELSKIAALGIKVHQACTYHGIALNVDMDLSPFKNINPCGFVGLPVVDLAECGVKCDLIRAGEYLTANLIKYVMKQNRVKSGEIG